MITDEEIARLEALERAMYPEPWMSTDDRFTTPQGDSCWGIEAGAELIVCDGNDIETKDPPPNIAGIVAMRNAFPALLAELRRLREESERLKLRADGYREDQVEEIIAQLNKEVPGEE